MADVSHALRRRRLRHFPVASPRLWRPRLVFWCGAVAVALVAIFFAVTADAAQDLFHRMIDGRPWLSLIIMPAGLALSIALTRWVFPGAQGSGIPQVIAALHMHDSKLVGAVLSLRIGLGKLVLTVLGLAAGASIGREGPTVQISASLMQVLGQRFGRGGPVLQRSLVLAGGAAGVAAAFNTPLAGIVFAIEELSHSYEARTSGRTLTTVIIAGIVSLALMGNYTYFGTASASLDFGPGWAAVLVCGVIGGALGGLFAEALLRLSRRLPGRIGMFLATRPIGFAALCGLLLAILGLISGGTTYGTGYAEARSLVEGHSALPAAFPLYKFLATAISYLSGIPGGIFAPSLSVGAGLGQWLSHLLPSSPREAVVLLGMVAYFCGVVQAPITAAVIVMEMTSNQTLMIPLMATSALAFAVSRLVCRRPFYGALAGRFLSATESAHAKAAQAAAAPPAAAAPATPPQH